MITSHDPRTGASNGSVKESSREQVSNAVESAVRAAPGIAAVPPAVRREWLHAVANEIESYIDELVALGDR